MTLKSFLVKEDKLCIECRNMMRLNRCLTDHGLFRVESFYEYDSLFRSLLLQYKECYDEALKDVFLYDISEYIFLRYFGYEIVLIPSSRKKQDERGFDHLELIFENVGLKINRGLKMKEDLIQEGKSAIERQAMINNYFYEGGSIEKALVVDDVMTTGASLTGAYHCLSKVAKILRFMTIAK